MFRFSNRLKLLLGLSLAVSTMSCGTNQTPSAPFLPGQFTGSWGGTVQWQTRGQRTLGINVNASVPASLWIETNGVRIERKGSTAISGTVMTIRFDPPVDNSVDPTPGGATLSPIPGNNSCLQGQAELEGATPDSGNVQVCK